jgi:hypothetical protein
MPTRRWEAAMAAEQERLRPLPAELDLTDIFSLHLERTVRKDGTFPFLGQRWALNRVFHRHRVAAPLDPRSALLGVARRSESGRLSAEWGRPTALSSVLQAPQGCPALWCLQGSCSPRWGRCPRGQHNKGQNTLQAAGLLLSFSNVYF